jgi:hypothetical protein
MNENINSDYFIIETMPNCCADCEHSQFWNGKVLCEYHQHYIEWNGYCIKHSSNNLEELTEIKNETH